MAGTRPNSRRMHQLRDDFFEEGKRLAADPETRHLSVCWLCKGDIDYEVEPGTTPDSHNLDHRKSYRDHPELAEDPDNFEHSHDGCNKERGADAPSLGLGEEMPAWW